MEDPQGTNPETKGTEPTPEGATPTEPEGTPTVKTYTEEDFQRAVSKGLENTQKQLDLQRAEAKKAMAEAEQFKAEQESLNAELQDLRSEYDQLSEKQFDDDPEARQAFLSRRAIADEKRKVAKAMAEAEHKLYDAEKLAWSVRMAQKANELHRETGIDTKELEDCQTEEEMEVKALRFQIGKPKEGPKDKTPKFAGGGGSGEGKDFSKMSADDKLKEGFRRLTKK